MEKIKHLISSSLLAAMLFTMCGCDDDKKQFPIHNLMKKRAIIRVLKLRKSSPKQKIPMK